MDGRSSGSGAISLSGNAGATSLSGAISLSGAASLSHASSAAMRLTPGLSMLRSLIWQPSLGLLVHW